MYAVKIFDLSGSAKASDVESIINLWFAAHPHLEFANIAVSGLNEFNIIKYVVTYKIKNLEQ